jgi:Family of unknown function (DUF6184)
MLRQHLWIGAAAIGLVCGCDRKESPNVDVSPARPAEPAVGTRNTERTDMNDTARPGMNDTDRTRTGDTAPLRNDDDSVRNTDEPSVQQGGVSAAAAVKSIVQARCSRETRCNNIGADRKYSSAAECNTKLSEDRKDDLNMDDCPRGVSQKELSECLAEIKNEDCNNPLDSLGRLAACRSSDLCMSTP